MPRDKSAGSWQIANNFGVARLKHITVVFIWLAMLIALKFRIPVGWVSTAQSACLSLLARALKWYATACSWFRQSLVAERTCKTVLLPVSRLVGFAPCVVHTMWMLSCYFWNRFSWPVVGVGVMFLFVSLLADYLVRRRSVGLSIINNESTEKVTPDYILMQRRRFF